MKKILLFTVIINSLLQADFIKSPDIVIDSKTGLEWQDNKETDSIQKTWQESIDYCEALNLKEHDDWRLPNINELKTIIDRNKIKPAIVDGFKYIGISNWYTYWSSSTIMGDEEKNAWFVVFYDGAVIWDPKNVKRYVRCVRDIK